MSERGANLISRMVEERGLVLPGGSSEGILSGKRVPLAFARLSVRSDIVIPDGFKEEFVDTLQPAIDLLGQVVGQTGFDYEETPDMADYWLKFRDRTKPDGRKTGQLTKFALELCSQEDFTSEVWPKAVQEPVLPILVSAKFAAIPSPVAHLLTLSLGVGSLSAGGNRARRVHFKGVTYRGYGERAWGEKAATMPRRTLAMQDRVSDW